MNKLECIDISKSFILNNESLSVLKNINISIAENERILQYQENQVLTKIYTITYYGWTRQAYLRMY